MNTIFGPLCDHLDLASRKEVTETKHGPLLRQVAWASPASEYRSVQPQQILVDLDHDHKSIGQVVHLERSRAGMLWCVAHVDERLRFASWAPERYFSATLSATRDASGTNRDIELLGVAITLCPTQTGLRPQSSCTASSTTAAYRRWQLGEPARGLLARANVSHLERLRSKGPIVIQDEVELSARKLRGGMWIDRSRGEALGSTSWRHAGTEVEKRPPGVIRIRPCGRILSVR